MAFVSISGLGVDIREMPSYCQASGAGTWAGYLAALNPLAIPALLAAGSLTITDLHPLAKFRELLPECQPYTERELSAMTQSQAVAVCKYAADPAACEVGLIAAAEEAQAAAGRSDPEGTCEYNATQRHTTLSSVLGPAAVCKLYAGDYTVYIVGAVVAAAALFMVMRGRGRR